MIRLALLWLFISYLGITAWKDWYRSLCGLILLMAVIQHPDFPNSLLGLQGLNPWNLLLFVVVLAWLTHRNHEGLRWDMPGKVNWLLVIYGMVILVAALRMLMDLDGYQNSIFAQAQESPTTASLVSEHIINSFKWVIPGLLLFDGCRCQKRLRMGITVVLLVYFLLAVQVIKWMPFSSIVSGEELSARSLKVLVKEVGFHRVNLSMMFAGASWAFFCCREFFGERRIKWMLLASVIVFIAQMLTGGRMGLVTWAVIGFVLLWSRWRRYLLVVPVLAAALLLMVPGAIERIGQGFTPTPETVRESSRFEGIGYSMGDGADAYTVTSGRNIAWPLVIEKIKEAPFIGYGKEAMIRTGLADYLLIKYNESFPHPHNAYLQLLLDNGFFGALCVLPFYLVILHKSYTLFKDNHCVEFTTVGGLCLSLILALLVASLGSQTFYPREGALGMWCSIGIMLRVYMQRSRIPQRNYESGGRLGEDILWKRIE